MWGQCRDRLVADWRTITKFWSVRMNAVGAILYPLLISVQAMPEPVQQMLPVEYRAIAAGLFAIASIIVRVFVQPKLNA